MPASTSRIGILILNHNGRQWLAPLYDSIRRNGYSDARIYLVDNGSTDGSIDFTLNEHPDVTVIHIPENIGYSMAYNLAMPHAFTAGCEWVIWANNDTLLEPGCLSELSEAADLDSAIGVLGPAFLSWDCNEPNYYMVGNHPGLVPAMEARSSKPVDVDWVEGSLLMVSRLAVETAGPLDPRFFAFWEEADFCRRVRYSGKRVVLVPSARARHYGGMSYSRESNRAMRDRLLARNFYVYTLTDPSRSFIRNILVSLRLLASEVKIGINKSPRDLLRTLRAYAAAWTGIGVWHSKWDQDRRHLKPEPLDKQYSGLQPEVLHAKHGDPAFAE